MRADCGTLFRFAEVVFYELSIFRVTVLSTFHGYHGNFKISGHLTNPLHITNE